MASRPYSRILKAVFRACSLCMPVLLAACAITAEAPMPETPAPAALPAPPVAPEPTPARDVCRATGTAAWYGKDMHGLKTASGSFFDMNGLTAAHRTLPLGTTIRVTNLENAKQVIVLITDRGPFAANRILDVSFGAAKELGFVEQGVARVSIESLEPIPAGGVFTVQAAMFTEEENAKLLKERLNRKFETVTIVPLDTNIIRFYRVRVGAYASLQRAEAVATKLTHEGLEPLVLRKD